MEEAACDCLFFILGFEPLGHRDQQPTVVKIDFDRLFLLGWG